jgi:hypothetical protein
VIRAIAWLIAIGIHVTLPVGGFVVYALGESLPPLPIGGDVFFPPPMQLNPLSLAQGATEAEVDTLFGVRSGSFRRLHHTCVGYQYSPRLSYVMLFREGVVQTMWLAEDGVTPYLCEGILTRTVQVRPRPWLPPELPRPASECGCPPWNSLSCSGL